MKAGVAYKYGKIIVSRQALRRMRSPRDHFIGLRPPSLDMVFLLVISLIVCGMTFLGHFTQRASSCLLVTNNSLS